MDVNLTRDQLLAELAALRRRVAEHDRILGEKEKQLEAFHAIGRTILQSLTLEEVVDNLADQIVRAGIYRSLMIALVDENERTVVPTQNLTRTPNGSFTRQRMDVTRDLDRSPDIVADVARTGRLEVIEGWDEERYDPNIDTPQSHKGKVAYFIPVKQDRRVLAVLATASQLEEKEETLRQIEAMAPLLDQVAIALEHCRLYEQIRQEVSDRERAEEELRRAHNLESLGVLAGGIAHDFNNILTGVTGNLTLLERLLEEGSEEHDIAVEARKSADRTSGLAQQLMTFAMGGSPVKTIATLPELIRSAADLSLSGSRTRPEYSFQVNLSRVEIDTGQIGQVVQNLVLNADQAMPEGGTLMISANNVALGGDGLLPLPEGTYVKVSVADQGIGMSEEVTGKVFDPYFTTKEAGHGLGLSIVYSIVSRHGGHITVHSEIDAGTTFEFYLPVSTRREAVVEEKAEIPAGTGRILVMDDEEIVRLTVSRMLEALGYEVESAGDGAEALQTYRAALEEGEPFDAVIMDLTIPGGMGGEEAVSELLAMHPEARAMVSSGYSNDPVIARYGDYGFVGSIKKPVMIQELAEIVRTALAGGAS